MEFNELMQILILLAIVLAFWWQHKSFPPEQTADLLKQLDNASRKTATPADDLLYDIAAALYEIVRNSEPIEGDPGLTDKQG